MTISEQIKVLCVRSDISVAELARRIGTSPQNLSGKMKRESLQSLLARIEYQSVVTKVCEKMLPNYNGKTFFFLRERREMGKRQPGWSCRSQHWRIE